MKNKKVGLVLIALTIIIFYWQFKSDPVIQVVGLAPDIGTVDRLVSNTRSGTVKSCRRANLSLPRGGQIQAIIATESQQVSAGDLLLELENSAIKAAKHQAESQLTIAKTQSQISCHQAELDKRDAKRIKQLTLAELVAEERFDLAQTQAQISQLQCQRDQQAIELASASLDFATAIWQETRLIAPFDGVIGQINAELGEYATPSPPGIATLPVIELLDPTCLYISVPIDEIDAGHIRTGLTAKVTLDAFGRRTFGASVTKLASFIDERQNAARTLEVDLQLDPLPEDVTLLMGYSADVEIQLETAENVQRIPTELLLPEDKVWIVDQEDNIQLIALDIGLRNWRYAELKKPLPEHSVLINNLSEIKPFAGAKAQRIDASHD